MSIEEQIRDIVKGIITDDLAVEISIDERSDYGYGGSAIYYNKVTVTLSLDGEVIHQSEASFDVDKCQC